MGCCVTFAKVFLVLLNIFIGFLGIVFLAVGAALEYGQTLVEQYVTPMLAELSAGMGADGSGGIEITEADWATIMSSIHLVAIPLIITGSVLFLVTISACCGVCCSNKTLLLVYSIIISVLTTVLVVLTVWVYVKKTELIESAEPELQAWVQREYRNETTMDLASIAVNFLNIIGDCCGIVDYRDFVNYPTNVTMEMNGASTTVEQVIPASCCNNLTLENPVPGDINCTVYPSQLNSNMHSGCSDFLSGYLYTYSDYIIYGVIGFLSFMCLLTLMAWLVCCSVANEKRMAARAKNSALSSGQLYDIYNPYAPGPRHIR